MRENEGFDILHNGMPRTFRDQKAMAYEAARFAKAQYRADIIEIVDRSTGEKVMMLADSRLLA
jgi:hypothetical protein